MENISTLFQKYLLWFLISAIIGVGVGISASKRYYNNKMKESIQVGGMLFDSKVYQIVPK